MPNWFVGFLTALTLLIGTTVSTFATENVDLELVLAADGSGSIDDAEFELQRRGYAAAITNPRVLAAITGGIHQAIAITYVEWAAPDSVATVVGWHMIHDAKSAKAFADKLVKAPRMVDGYNSISAAILYGVNEIEKNAYSGIRKIIDISGDGPQINGPPLPFARNYALSKGITINAIAIDTPYDPRTGPNGEPLAVHYKNDVIGGQSPFVLVAKGRKDLAKAILRKLILEIAARPTSDVTP
ncbi:MAG: hypothetical protein CMM48_15100 [Rhodospirillaceae bacterium]|nr:hypothetical protein [Rhodospirillaceae bacterium]HAA92397.1 hypothetical protein [Rhodospirillaceae bacterium]|tara:strand:+ start:393 stop:1118 length:726 start_codon:yes stop_codon:yes gene_type:complete